MGAGDLKGCCRSGDHHELHSINQATRNRVDVEVYRHATFVFHWQSPSRIVCCGPIVLWVTGAKYESR